MTNNIEVEDKMITLRNQQVILDSDVADLYAWRPSVLMTLRRYFFTTSPIACNTSFSIMK